MWCVTGDFRRLVYSRHKTKLLAEAALLRLSRRWGWSHPGSEPRVVEVPPHLEGAMRRRVGRLPCLR